MSVVKTTGAEFKAFYADPEIFPERAYHDDLLVHVNGEVFFSDEGPCAHWSNTPVEDIPDDSEVVIECGCIVYENSEEDVLKLFRQWQERRNTTRFIVQCARDEAARLKAIVEAAGGKILGA